MHAPIGKTVLEFGSKNMAKLRAHH